MTQPAPSNPFLPFIEHQGSVVLDGGLATTLESYSHDLDDLLWSAKVLLEAPESIRRAHLEFLEAGADCIATASYQASFEGFTRRGLSRADCEHLLRLSVDLAVEARDEFWAVEENREGRLRPLVAASIGPYGAFLADGSEYRGRYDICDDELHAFHQERWQILAESAADLLACETIPSRSEASVLSALLEETPDRWAWISFSCRDGVHLSDGSRLEEIARDCETTERIAALGINCTAPRHIDSLIREARKGTTKPIVVYPNQGELYDPETKTWSASPESTDWRRESVRWNEMGAVGVGGCCRTGPVEIGEIRAGLLGSWS
jgi:homocysteine S-methyltransferase